MIFAHWHGAGAASTCQLELGVEMCNCGMLNRREKYGTFKAIGDELVFYDGAHTHWPLVAVIHTFA